MKTLNKQKTLQNLISRQKAIVYESPEDEGAAEHYAEIESCIIAIKSKHTDQDVIAACEYVGLNGDLSYE